MLDFGGIEVFKPMPYYDWNPACLFNQLDYELTQYIHMVVVVLPSSGRIWLLEEKSWQCPYSLLVTARGKDGRGIIKECNSWYMLHSIRYASEVGNHQILHTYPSFLLDSDKRETHVSIGFAKESNDELNYQ